MIVVRVNSSCIMILFDPMLVEICNIVHAFDILIHGVVEVAVKTVPKSPKYEKKIYQLLSSTTFINTAIKCKITEN